MGLLRTEFLYLDRTTSSPTEAEQLESYRAIANILGSRPLTIRTLDVGVIKRFPMSIYLVKLIPFSVGEEFVKV